MYITEIRLFQKSTYLQNFLKCHKRDTCTQTKCSSFYEITLTFVIYLDIRVVFL